MSEPKVPEWMECVGRQRWALDSGSYVRYQAPDDYAVIDAHLTARELRELADLIDSCQEDDNE